MDSAPDGCGAPHPYSLKDLGWTPDLDAAFARFAGPYVPGRVACRQKTAWEVLVEGGAVTTGISGAMKRLGRHPAVGDFVVLLRQPEAGTSMIVDILPQKSRFTRGAAGREGTDQVIAANVDTVFIVTATGADLSPRRIERYLTIAHASGARPVVVINKCDLVDDPASLVAEIATVAAGIPVVPISAASGAGFEALEPYLVPASTIALVGSSGVGKSTLINRLLGRSEQETSQTRSYDERGRHTTTVRQLFVLHGGVLMIDNPGLREVGIGTASAGLAETFPDILSLAAGCRFSDCRHGDEPGCAVTAAVETGSLPPSRLESYRRLARELAFEQEKAEIGLVRSERKRWKQYSGNGNLAKEIRAVRDW